MFTSLDLSPESRTKLLKVFPPQFSKVIAHHITLEFGVPKGTPIPESAEVKVLGLSSGDGIEAAVVTVDGSWQRSDGGVYHITLSLEPDRYKPYDSNALIKREGFVALLEPFEIQTFPALYL